jgi:hypothetical protein
MSKEAESSGPAVIPLSVAAALFQEFKGSAC